MELKIENNTNKEYDIIPAIESLGIQKGKPTIMYGSAVSGKTIFLANLALGIAGNNHCLLKPSEQNKKVVFVANQELEEEIYLLHHRLMKGSDDNVWKMVSNNLNLVSQYKNCDMFDDNFAKLKSLCEGASLLIIDCLGGFFSGMELQQQYMVTTEKKMEILREFSIETGCAIIATTPNLDCLNSCDDIYKENLTNNSSQMIKAVKDKYGNFQMIVKQDRHGCRVKTVNYAVKGTHDDMNYNQRPFLSVEIKELFTRSIEKMSNLDKVLSQMPIDTVVSPTGFARDIGRFRNEMGDYFRMLKKDGYLDITAKGKYFLTELGIERRDELLGIERQLYLKRITDMEYLEEILLRQKGSKIEKDPRAMAMLKLLGTLGAE